jgi:hypothetical protein
VSSGFLVNFERKEELDKEHVQDVDTYVEDIDNNIGIKDLLVDDDQLDKELVLCRNCHQVGHVELYCFDVHPCVIHGKKNHVSKRCWNRLKIPRKQVNFEWLGTWHWSLESKLLERSYQ